jgi:hypothetical protein
LIIHLKPGKLKSQNLRELIQSEAFLSLHLFIANTTRIFIVSIKYFWLEITKNRLLNRVIIDLKLVKHRLTYILKCVFDGELEIIELGLML